jgi:16S rRNA (cytosine967-C5)-methyltransferase
VLVDAPCSGIGTWNRNPDMRWRTAAADVAAKAAVQREVLARAARGVRPGGVLVYAVCTVTAAETTDVAGGFGRSHPDFAAEPVAHPLTGERQVGVFWIWPWDGPCDGMFCARWRRG